MGVYYECIYCGKKSPEEPLNVEGKVRDVLDYIDKKNAEWSNKCECRKNIKVKYEHPAFGWNDMLTEHMEYEVGETDTKSGEYWIVDDHGEYNPFPMELFEEIG